MKSRWCNEDAQKLRSAYAGPFGPAFADRLYTARLIGQDCDLVLHGGGNVSVKGHANSLLGEAVEVVHVKASGCDLAEIEPAGLPALELAPLRRLRALIALDDSEMVNQLRRSLLQAAAPTPSIETLLHAFLAPPFVDHSHADAVLCLTNQPEGERLIREALGDRVAVLPYIKPGFELAKAAVAAFEADPHIEGMVLIHHGLITFGDDARSSYERHVALVDACERFIAARASGRSLSAAFRPIESPAALAASAAPVLRGLIARPTGHEDRPFDRTILEWRAGEATLTMINSAEAGRIAAAGPLTGDHLIRTKAKPMYVPSPDWRDPSALRKQLAAAVAAYRADYERYLRAHGARPEDTDTAPRVVMLPGAGLLCSGRTKRDAAIAADIAEHTLGVKAKGGLIGSYDSLAERHLFDMEFRGLQIAKLDRREALLGGQIVAISGGAGAIGSAIAEVCAEAGAHVAIADREPARARPVIERIQATRGRGTAIGVEMDVTDEESVRRGYAEIVRQFGGLDVIVPNAGIAHVAPLDKLSVAEFRRVMDVNAAGYLLFMQEGVRVLKEQGLGGNIVVVSSKNVLGPGKDFAAYSASKAAAHQLGRVAALELAGHGIRVNMLAPDAVFGDESAPSGLWAAVGPDRARLRNLSPEDLPEYYRERNLLKARVSGRHVGHAVVFFASNATPTTGAVLPIDGGIPAAFPR